MEFLKGKTVLISGASGYLGSTFVSKIADADLKDLFLMVRSNDYNFDLGNKAKIIEGDISEKNTWQLVFENKIDFIFHFAGVSISQKNTQEIFKSNFYSSIRFVESYLESNSEAKVIYLSSSNISSAQNEIIINENTFDDLNSEWSASKKMSEMLFHLSKHKGFKCVSLRLPNVYGVAANPNAFYRMSINKMIETAISKKMVMLYSNHKLKRDFMHISDVTDSIFAAAKCFDLLFQREFYYVGSESLYSYDDLAEVLKEILYEKDMFISKLYDFNKQVTAIEMRAGSIDSSLFRDITNWKSRYKLKDGLSKAINDYYSMNI